MEKPTKACREKLSPLEQEVLDEVSRDGKIAGIKVWRKHYDCGLKEAKDMVEALMHSHPYPINDEPLHNGDLSFLRTSRDFNLKNLVDDCACTCGLRDLLKYTVDNNINILDKMTFPDFKVWFHQEGFKHYPWLLDHDYLCPIRHQQFFVGDTFIIAGHRYMLTRTMVIDCNNEPIYMSLTNTATGNAWSTAIQLPRDRAWSITRSEFAQLVGSEVDTLDTVIHKEEANRIINTRKAGPNTDMR